MKKLILVRMFAQGPNPRVTNVLGRHMSQTPNRPIAFPAPGCVVTVFETTSDVSVITEELRTLGVFFILAPIENAGVILPMEIMTVCQNYIGTPSNPAPTATRQFSLDELLDLISSNGRASLTAEQETQLMNLTSRN